MKIDSSSSLDRPHEATHVVPAAQQYEEVTHAMPYNVYGTDVLSPVGDAATLQLVPPLHVRIYVCQSEPFQIIPDAAQKEEGA